MKTYYIKKSSISHRVVRPSQTGFSSPATHYNEPRIDLNDVLIDNPSATFYVRVTDNSFSDYGVNKQDVLIIDKSLTPKKNQLALVTQEDSFAIIRIKETEEKTTLLWGIIIYIIKSTK